MTDGNAACSKARCSMYVFMKECAAASCFCGVQKPSFDELSNRSLRFVGLAGSAQENCTCSVLYRLLINRHWYTKQQRIQFSGHCQALCYRLRLSSCSAHALVSQADCLLTVSFRVGAPSQTHSCCNTAEILYTLRWQSFASGRCTLRMATTVLTANGFKTHRASQGQVVRNW